MDPVLLECPERRQQIDDGTREPIKLPDDHGVEAMGARGRHQAVQRRPAPQQPGDPDVVVHRRQLPAATERVPLDRRALEAHGLIARRHAHIAHRADGFHAGRFSGGTGGRAVPSQWYRNIRLLARWRWARIFPSTLSAMLRPQTEHLPRGPRIMA